MNEETLNTGLNNFSKEDQKKYEARKSMGGYLNPTFPEGTPEYVIRDTRLKRQQQFKRATRPYKNIGELYKAEPESRHSALKPKTGKHKNQRSGSGHGTKVIHSKNRFTNFKLH